MDINEFLEFSCPYCGSTNSLTLDLYEGKHQELIQDCETCCSPFVIQVELSDSGVESISVRKENE